MWDLIAIGSATLDVIIRSQSLEVIGQQKQYLSLEAGGKLDADEAVLVSGGGATNVAVGCQRLGLQTAIVCELGRDLASQAIWKDLHREGVNTDFVITEKLEKTAVSALIIPAQGQRSILTYRGAASMLDIRDVPWAKLAQTKWIHLGSLGGNSELAAELLVFFQQHRIHCSWTPSKQDLQWLARGSFPSTNLQLDFLILNLAEWEVLRAQETAIFKVSDKVIITNGKNGGKVYQNGQAVLNYQAILGETIEETGAGDAFATGVIAATLHGRDLKEAVEWGKRNSSSVVKFLGAKKGLLTKSQITKE